MSTLRSQIFPIGAVYITVVNVNPQTFLGGTWVQFGHGRTLMGMGLGYTVPLAEGGQQEVTLTANQSGVRDHSHGINIVHSDGPLVPHVAEGMTFINATGIMQALHLGSFGANVLRTRGGTVGHTPTNAIQSHENRPPFITVFFWRRTA